MSEYESNTSQQREKLDSLYNLALKVISRVEENSNAADEKNKSDLQNLNEAEQELNKVRSSLSVLSEFLGKRG